MVGQAKMCPSWRCSSRSGGRKRGREGGREGGRKENERKAAAGYLGRQKEEGRKGGREGLTHTRTHSLCNHTLNITHPSIFLPHKHTHTHTHRTMRTRWASLQFGGCRYNTCSRPFKSNICWKTEKKEKGRRKGQAKKGMEG